ncbi:MAG TPA: hypothetical protein GXX60_03785 [Anaerolineaceae bacterium]|nr:hypothetical protein [Anaerolineaceae bacterium]
MEQRFQSTPPRGRRQPRDQCALSGRCFNPRLHAGGDTIRHGADMEEKVSIHASTREATLRHQQMLLETMFQSTPPRGRRRRNLDERAKGTGFNPRLHAGGDTITGDQYKGMAGFQSTPPRGRRLGETEHVAVGVVFQSTPPRGRRLRYSEEDLQARVVSIHASTREATVLVSGTELLAVFQSTPPRGRRPGYSVTRQK